jgi:small subunit ribosomal protein S6
LNKDAETVKVSCSAAGPLFFLLLAKGQSQRKEASRVRDYELVLIIAPPVEDENIPETVDKVGRWIQADGGEVTKVDVWGQRKLAYPIQDYTEGTYVCLNAQLKPDALDELERNLKLDMDIIRYLLVRMKE